MTRSQPRTPVLDPGHGEAFTDHAVAMTWSPGSGWSQPRLEPFGALAVHPATIGLHYAQAIFEGLKAYRRADGSMAIFRPWLNARRFQRSAARLQMPAVPEGSFVGALERLVAADHGWLSDDPEHSLYLRPLMLGTDRSLMLRPSRTYLFLVMAFVAGGFFGAGAPAISVRVSRDHCRSYPGGTGDVKVAANYAPSFNAQQQAQLSGCQQVLWLDAVERTWVEEMSGMNVFFVRGRGSDATVATPPLTGTLLPGVTRDSLLTLAARGGYAVAEERISIGRLLDELATGLITEMFACGTAAVVTPVARVCDGATEWTVGDGTAGPVTAALRRNLVDIQRGVATDPAGWMHAVPAAGG